MSETIKPNPEGELRINQLEGERSRYRLLQNPAVRQFIFGGPIQRTERGFNLTQESGEVRMRFFSRGGPEGLEYLLDEFIPAVISENPKVTLGELIDAGVQRRNWYTIPLTGVDLAVAWRIQEGLVPDEQFDDPIFQRTLDLLEQWRDEYHGYR